MVKGSVFAILVVVWAGCGPEAGTEAPERDAIAVMYVSGADLAIHESPSESASILATYKNSEAVSILADKGEWVEVRLGADRKGWAQKNGLSGSRESSAGEPVESVGSSPPQFVRAPAPVFSQSGLTGEIVLEASVNSDGDVVSVRTLRNTTGSASIESENIGELKKAKFYPMRTGGAARPFIYEYRVTY